MAQAFSFLLLRLGQFVCVNCRKIFIDLFTLNNFRTRALKRNQDVIRNPFNYKASAYIKRNHFLFY